LENGWARLEYGRRADARGTTFSAWMRDRRPHVLAPRGTSIAAAQPIAANHLLPAYWAISWTVNGRDARAALSVVTRVVERTFKSMWNRPGFWGRVSQISPRDACLRPSLRETEKPKAHLQCASCFLLLPLIFLPLCALFSLLSPEIKVDELQKGQETCDKKHNCQ